MFVWARKGVRRDCGVSRSHLPNGTGGNGSCLVEEVEEEEGVVVVVVVVGLRMEWVGLIQRWCRKPISAAARGKNANMGTSCLFNAGTWAPNDSTPQADV